MRCDTTLRACIRPRRGCGDRMESVVVYDCEFLTAAGAPARFWSGPNDPDPLCVQIGAVRLKLEPPFDLSAPTVWYVQPMDRDGRIVPVDPLLTRLTGICDAMLEQRGMPLVDALGALAAFADGDLLLSWGKDDLLTLAASLFVQDHVSPMPAGQFRNATPLLLSAGEDLETVHHLRSHTICTHFGLDQPGPAHDAGADAAGVASALRHLLVDRRLRKDHFRGLRGIPA